MTGTPCWAIPCTAISRSPRRVRRSPKRRRRTSSTRPGCSGCARSTSSRAPGGSTLRRNTAGSSTPSAPCISPGSFARHLYPSLKAAVPDCPSANFIEELLRVAALLHDIGHGPFGHFFDDNYLEQFDLTHEKLGQHIIRTQLARHHQGHPQEPFGRVREAGAAGPRPDRLPHREGRPGCVQTAALARVPPAHALGHLYGRQPRLCPA